MWPLAQAEGGGSDYGKLRRSLHRPRKLVSVSDMEYLSPISRIHVGSHCCEETFIQGYFKKVRRTTKKAMTEDG